MPELPEVETIRIALSDKLLKCKILKVFLKSKKLRFLIPYNIKKIEKCYIKRINRKGKYLIFEINSGSKILMHLGMTGFFKIQKRYVLEKHDHLIFKFKDFFLTYNDVRRFGFIKYYSDNEYLKSEHIIKLGKDPLLSNFNAGYIVEKIRKKNQNIKNFLMNQANIAGLGNIYCSEILFDSNISPLRNAKKIKLEEITKLVISTKKILTKAIKLGGTSLKDFKNPDGKLGYFKNRLKVYDRENKSCYKCKDQGNIKKIYIGGRSTFFCNNCQK